MQKLLIPILLTPLLWADCSPNQKQQAQTLWKESQNMQGNQKLKTLQKALQSCSLSKIMVDLSIADIENRLEQDNLSLELLENLDRDIAEIRSRNESLFLNNLRDKNAYKISALTNKVALIEEKIQTNQEELKKLRAYRENSGEGKGFGSGERLLLPVLFANGKSTVRGSSNIKSLISRIKATLKEDKNAQFSITGYASSIGRASSNMKLSKKRARNLKNYLERYIPQGHIDPHGKGESNLICNHNAYPIALGHGEYCCTNGTENEASSRRVEILRRR